MIESDAEYRKFSELYQDGRLEYPETTERAQWDAYYGLMAPYLQSGHPRVRGVALERLSMAVMRAEPMRYMRYTRGRIPPEHAAKRLAWLTNLVTQAHSK